jgi:hypothetical protein
MGRFESILEEFLTQFEFIEQSFMDLAQTISKNQTEIIAAIDDSRNQESDHFSIITNNQKGIITTLDDRFNNVDCQLQQIYDQGEGNQILLMDTIFENHEEVIETVKFSHQTLLSGINIIDSKIESMGQKMTEDLDDLKIIIVEKIESRRVDFVNNLSLVLRAIQLIPGRTAETLMKSIQLPKTTLYNCLKTLSENNLVAVEKKKPLFPSKGNKPKKFFSMV